MWSAQLHLHGSFSEGIGSIESQAVQARDVGVDVLWWSDHDFRIGAYRLASCFGFEGPEEPIDLGEAWSKRLSREDSSTKGLQPSRLSQGKGNFAYTSDQAIEGQRSLRLQSKARSRRFRPYLMSWYAKRSLHVRPVATGVSVEIAIFPERCNTDARGIVYIQFSEHPPAFEQHALHYYLSGPGASAERRGNTYLVPLPYELGRWNEYTLDLVADLRRGFPEYAPGDNAMVGIELGVETRGGAEASVLFDRLQVVSELFGAEGYQVQRQMLANRNAAGGDPTHLLGVEISYEAYHLNEFSLTTELLDYDRIASTSGLMDGQGRIDDAPRFRDHVTRLAVAAAHERGGLISYNHMFGAGFEGTEERRKEKVEVLAELLEKRVFGADLLEVGYRDRGGAPLSEHLWVWDQLATEGLRLVGLGTSDYHGGEGAGAWRSMSNNFVSWIYAEERSKSALLEGLRAGRVFFGDITRFDGRVDLETARGFRMGDVVLTDRDSVVVIASVDGLAGGERLVLVGHEGLLAEGTSSGSTGTLTGRLRLRPGGRGLARLEVYGSDGEAVVFSNPIWFERAGQITAAAIARARLDVAGVRDIKLSGNGLLGARALPEGNGIEIYLDAPARGSITLDLGANRGRRIMDEIEGLRTVRVLW